MDTEEILRKAAVLVTPKPVDHSTNEDFNSAQHFVTGELQSFPSCLLGLPLPSSSLFAVTLVFLLQPLCFYEAPPSADLIDSFREVNGELVESLRADDKHLCEEFDEKSVELEVFI